MAVIFFSQLTFADSFHCALPIVLCFCSVHSDENDKIKIPDLENEIVTKKEEEVDDDDGKFKTLNQTCTT